jgi:hypothetical protein
MARKSYRRHRRTRSRRHTRRHRGGAGAPDPSSYSSAASYGQAVLGDMNSQYNRVFDISGPDGANQSNTIVGLQGQRAGRRRRGGSRRKRGGLWGEVINQAVVPLALLGMQQRYNKRGMNTRRRR